MTSSSALCCRIFRLSYVLLLNDAFLKLTRTAPDVYLKTFCITSKTYVSNKMRLFTLGLSSYLVFLMYFTLLSFHVTLKRSSCFYMTSTTLQLISFSCMQRGTKDFWSKTKFPNSKTLEVAFLAPYSFKESQSIFSIIWKMEFSNAVGNWQSLLYFGHHWNAIYYYSIYLHGTLSCSYLFFKKLSFFNDILRRFHAWLTERRQKITILQHVIPTNLYACRIKIKQIQNMALP